MRRVFERTLLCIVIGAIRPTDKLPLFRYISQVRQETAMRLHARLYPGGEGPSKVDLTCPEVPELAADDHTVLA